MNSKQYGITVVVSSILVVLISLACWELFASSAYDAVNGGEPKVKSILGGNVVDDLKKEINGNLLKFHNEMGFAEWIIYFVYGAIITILITIIILIIIFLLLTTKTQVKCKDQAIQTDADIISASSVLKDLLDTIDFKETQQKHNHQQQQRSNSRRSISITESESGKYSDQEEEEDAEEIEFNDDDEVHDTSMQTEEPSVVCYDDSDETDEVKDGEGQDLDLASSQEVEANNNSNNNNSKHSISYERSIMLINFYKNRSIFPFNISDADNVSKIVSSSAILITNSLSEPTQIWDEYYYQHYSIHIQDYNNDYDYNNTSTAAKTTKAKLAESVKPELIEITI